MNYGHTASLFFLKIYIPNLEFYDFLDVPKLVCCEATHAAAQKDANAISKASHQNKSFI